MTFLPNCIKMDNQTQIIARPGAQELFVIREFDAPRNLVFRAFSEPDLLIRFFAPKGVNMTFLEDDYREGKSYRYRHTDDQGNVLCTFRGMIHEMTSPQRIVLTSEFEELPERGHVVLEIYEFEDLPNGRTKVTIQDVCRSVTDRDAMIQSGMEGGLVSIFNNLDDLLKETF